MRIHNGLVVLVMALLLNFGLNGQSVNDKVTKDNLDQKFLKSLILERIGEIRSYKKAPELLSNNICGAVAELQAGYMAKKGERTSAQEDENLADPVKRLKSYGASKKAKGAEITAEISLEGQITYMDLSDDITSSWLNEKNSVKTIENKAFTVCALAFEINAEKNTLYVAFVFGDKAVGNNLTKPSQPATVTEEPAKEEPKTASTAEDSKKEEPKKEEPTKEGSNANTTATTTEKPVDNAPAKTAEEKTIELKTEAEDEKTVAKAETPKADSPAKTTPAKLAAKPATTTKPAPKLKAKASASSGKIERIPDEELPTCINPMKYDALVTSAERAVMGKGMSVYFRGSELETVKGVLKGDQDMLGITVDENHSFSDGPTVFDYALLVDKKFYKAQIETAPEGQDILVRDDLKDSAMSGHYAYKMTYYRMGFECLTIPVIIGDSTGPKVVDTPVITTPVADLELVWNGDMFIDTTKTYKNVTVRIPFRKGKANYKAEDLIAMMDTLVEPGFKIVAADVTAFASVEGDSTMNAKLARTRGKNVVEALRELNGGTLFYGKLVNSESWDHFYANLDSSAHPEFKDMSKEEIKGKLRPGMEAAKDMEAILSAERYAEILLSLEYLSPEAETGKEESFIEIKNIYYDFSKFYIRKEAGQALDKFSKLLKWKPEYNLVEIGAHTDSRGSYAFNEKLSQRRAQAVVDYLISKGIDRSRLTPNGYGESELLNNCKDGIECSEAEHQRNRRTTFRILSEGGEDIISKEDDDLAMNYAPSFQPKDGLINLEDELKVELENKNGDGASRVYRRMIKRVLLDQMDRESLVIEEELPMDTAYSGILVNQLLVKHVIFNEVEGIGEAFGKIVELNSKDPFAVYNYIAFNLMNNQAFVAELIADASKKSQVVGILNSIQGTDFDEAKLTNLINFVNSL